MERNFIKIILTSLPKISLNEWYSGNHWSKRKRIKDVYSYLVKSQLKEVFPKTEKYNVVYTFYFKSKPLDSTNTVAMAKMLEDIIFEDDKYDIVLSTTLMSRKDKNERVEIEIYKY